MPPRQRGCPKGGWPKKAGSASKPEHAMPPAQTLTRAAQHGIPPTQTLTRASEQRLRAQLNAGEEAPQQRLRRQPAHVLVPPSVGGRTRAGGRPIKHRSSSSDGSSSGGGGSSSRSSSPPSCPTPPPSRRGRPATAADPAWPTLAVPAQLTQAVPAQPTRAIPARLTQAVPARLTQVEEPSSNDGAPLPPMRRGCPKGGWPKKKGSESGAPPAQTLTRASEQQQQQQAQVSAGQEAPQQPAHGGGQRRAVGRPRRHHSISSSSSISRSSSPSSSPSPPPSKRRCQAAPPATAQVEEPSSDKAAPRRRGCPKGGWPKKKGSEHGAPLTQILPRASEQQQQAQGSAGEEVPQRQPAHVSGQRRAGGRPRKHHSSGSSRSSGRSSSPSSSPSPPPSRWSRPAAPPAPVQRTQIEELPAGDASDVPLKRRGCPKGGWPKKDADLGTCLPYASGQHGSMQTHAQQEGQQQETQQQQQQQRQLVQPRPSSTEVGGSCGLNTPMVAKSIWGSSQCIIIIRICITVLKYFVDY